MFHRLSQLLYRSHLVVILHVSNFVKVLLACNLDANIIHTERFQHFHGHHLNIIIFTHDGIQQASNC